MGSALLLTMALQQGLMIAVLLSPLAVRTLRENPVHNDHEAEVVLGEALRTYEAMRGGEPRMAQPASWSSMTRPLYWIS